MDHNMDSDKEKDESPSERSLESVQETTPPPPAPKKRSLPLRAAKAIANQWFLISLGLVILLTSQVQVPLAHQKLKQTIVSYACVSLIFFLTGCTLKTSILLANYSKWRMHLFVQLQSYLLTSSIIFGLVSACATSRTFMDPGLLLGLIMCGCTPTTIASNVVMTGQAHGNQALTVVESTLGNFLGPFLTPLLFAMYTSSGAWYTAALPTGRGSYGAIYARVFKQLGLSLFLPMVRASSSSHTHTHTLSLSTSC
jgi:sodium/bile acid cotransporter 7